MTRTTMRLSPLDAHLAFDAFDLGLPHLNDDQHQKEPAAGVPPGENARNGALERHDERDGDTEGERDEEPRLRPAMPHEPGP